MIQIIALAVVLLIQSQDGILLPIEVEGRRNINAIELTSIGQFGLERVARPEVPAHLHTGIDILPPNNSYQTKSLIYAIAPGRVISKRTDGPFAQLIIEHQLNTLTFWTVYEHIAEIQVDLFQPIDTSTPIARFFMIEELDRYGHQFNHFHFEILKRRPVELQINSKLPERRFNSYSLSCKTESELNTYFYDPLVFFEQKISY